MVAPDHADLPNVAAELAAVSSQHDTVRLVGMVRDADMASVVQEGPFDVLWFASHGSKHGVLLSDGPLDIQGVGQYVRAAGAKLCVLNTCDSENVALSIISGGTADMICTIGPVGDQNAARLAILLAGELTRTRDSYEAYLQVRPEGGSYRYYKAGAAAPVHRNRWTDRSDEVSAMMEMIYETRLNINILKTWLIVMAIAIITLVLAHGALWVRVDVISRQIQYEQYSTPQTGPN
jgi:hypothetical protein